MCFHVVYISFVETMFWVYDDSRSININKKYVGIIKLFWVLLKFEGSGLPASVRLDIQNHN